MLERCLIGEPLAPGEKPPNRLLRIRIASTYASPPIIGEEPGHWPQRCRRFAEDFERACWRSGVADSCGVSDLLAKGELWDPEELWQMGAKFSGTSPKATADPSAVAPAATAAIAPKWTSLANVTSVKSDSVSQHGLILLLESLLESKKSLLCAFGPIDSPHYAATNARCLRPKKSDEHPANWGRNAAIGDTVDVADLGDKTLLVWARADDVRVFGRGKG